MYQHTCLRICGTVALSITAVHTERTVLTLHHIHSEEGEYRYVLNIITNIYSDLVHLDLDAFSTFTFRFTF